MRSSAAATASPTRSRQVEAGGFDLAILDVNLKGEKVWPVADRAAPRRARRSSSPPAAMSIRRRPSIAGAPMIAKPYTIDAIEPAHRSGLRRSDGWARTGDAQAASDSAACCRLCRLSRDRYAARHDLLPDRAAVPDGHVVPRPGRCRRAPSGSSSTTPGGERLHGVHIPPSAAAAAERLLILGFGGNAWNGAGRRRPICTSSFPKRDVVAFHYRGYRAVDRQPVGPGADRGCAAHPRLGGRAAPAGADRRGRLQHRQRRRRQLVAPPPARRADPGDAVRFARGGRRRPFSLAAGRPVLPA